MIGWLLGTLFGERRFREAGPRTTSFVRGLVLGALVGAAVAGILRGRRKDRRPQE